ncbi:Golgi membrane protein 1 isoform X2 [Strix aluco]|uniref:Golgi membrane protein 1 isoform X2 n=1 Tax=Strix aluco TaxID=111821 RepID=UPI003DA488A5
MVGLGNSCRGMKSPPLLVAALVACIIVLGFNYWIASSRSVDLQGQIMDLEGKVRRAAVERGAVELKKNEFQGELEKQRQQIDKIQSLHSFQMENANRVHQEEKAVLLSNITVNERLIQSLREHLKELQSEYGKLQLDIYWFQKNQTNLQRKFSYDLSQCISQMKEVNIQMPAVKQTEFKQANLEHQKPNEDAPKAVPTVKKTDPLQAKERINGLAEIRKQEPKAEEKLSSQLKNPQDSLKAAAGYKEMLPTSEKELNLSEDEERLAGQDVLQLAAEHATNEETEKEQLRNDDAKQDDLPPGKADKQDHEALNQDKDVDYNLDENEAESETDKQAALAGIENVQNEDTKNHLSEHGEERQRL